MKKDKHVKFMKASLVLVPYLQSQICYSFLFVSTPMKSGSETFSSFCSRPYLHVDPKTQTKCDADFSAYPTLIDVGSLERSRHQTCWNYE